VVCYFYHIGVLLVLGTMIFGGLLMTNLRKNKNTLILIMALSFVAVLIVQLLGAFVYSDAISNTIIRDTSIRIGFGALFVIIAYFMGYSLFNKKKKIGLLILVVILPGLVIALNNFPISAYFGGRTVLNEPVHIVWLYAVECLSIGFLEETIFRGIILIVLIERFAKTFSGRLKAIIISALCFGAIHLVNLFSGAQVAATLLQVGYSFLMGAMWAVIFLSTGNLLYVMLLHGAYNFFGQVLSRFGVVINRFDLVTTIVTIVFALLAAMIYCRVLVRIKQEDLERLYLTNIR